jgi:hypothetical protein
MARTVRQLAVPPRWPWSVVVVVVVVVELAHGERPLPSVTGKPERCGNPPRLPPRVRQLAVRQLAAEGRRKWLSPLPAPSTGERSGRFLYGMQPSLTFAIQKSSKSSPFFAPEPLHAGQGSQPGRRTCERGTTDRRDVRASERASPGDGAPGRPDGRGRPDGAGSWVRGFVGSRVRGRMAWGVAWGGGLGSWRRAGRGESGRR